MAIGWTIFSCVIPYLRPLITAYERDGLSSKHGSSYKATGPSSQNSRRDSRPPQQQPSFNHTNAARTAGFDLRNQAGVSEEDGVMRVSRGSGRSNGGIEKTVKVELKDYEPTGQNSTQTKEDTGVV